MMYERMKRRIKPSKRDGVWIAVGAIGALTLFGLFSLIKNTVETPLAPESDKVTIKWLSPTVKHWEKTINEMGAKYDIDPNLIAIIMTLESGGYSKAGSEAGAQGLMQVTPPTGGDIAARYLKEPRTKYDLMDPKTSIEFGTAYLALLRDEFGDDPHDEDWLRTVEIVAAGYNGGPGTANALEQGEGLRDTEPVIYSRDAFNMWRERHAPSSPTFDRWKERGGSELINLAKDEQSKR